MVLVTFPLIAYDDFIASHNLLYNISSISFSVGYCPNNPYFYLGYYKES